VGQTAAKLRRDQGLDFTRNIDTNYNIIQPHADNAEGLMMVQYFQLSVLVIAFPAFPDGYRIGLRYVQLERGLRRSKALIKAKKNILVTIAVLTSR